MTSRSKDLIAFPTILPSQDFRLDGPLDGQRDHFQFARLRRFDANRCRTPSLRHACRSRIEPLAPSRFRAGLRFRFDAETVGLGRAMCSFMTPRLRSRDRKTRCDGRYSGTPASPRPSSICSPSRPMRMRECETRFSTASRSCDFAPRFIDAPQKRKRRGSEKIGPGRIAIFIQRSSSKPTPVRTCRGGVSPSRHA